MDDPDDTPSNTGSRGFKLLVILTAAAIAGYFLLGMPGMDHGNSMPGMDHNQDLGALALAEFETALRDPNAFLINVHTPPDQTIPGTDAVIAFDELPSPRMPEGKATKVLLYCETGSMSSQAAMSLLQAGYLDVAHLKGGLEAWRRSDRTLERRTGSGT